MGLTICRHLTEAMGGRIWVESEVGKGSSFNFTALFKDAGGVSTEEERSPARDAAVSKASEVESAESPVTGPRQALRPLRILLVEDAPANRKLVLAFLKKTPHQVDVAENGEIAVEKFKRGTYDLVLMDIEMPVMDGFTATREIRRWEAENEIEATPVVALTAHALTEHKQQSLAAGCDAHLIKPIKKQALLEALEDYGKIKSASP